MLKVMEGSTMQRRDFLQTGLGVALLTGVGACGEPVKNGGADLVATPESREAYLRGLLREICGIGPRIFASPAYDRAAEIIKREFERSLPDVGFHTFPANRWLVKNGTSLEIGDSAIESYLLQQSPGTPPDGLTGIVKQEHPDDDTMFAVHDRKTGEVKAYIFVSTLSRVFSRNYGLYEEVAHGLPGFTVARDNLPALLDAGKNRIPVTVYGEVEWIFDTPASNVIGVLPGETTDECVFIAHLDSIYISRGANDNLATLITMLMWAHALSVSKPKKTLTFLATAGEEIGYIGAKEYVKTRTEDGTIDKIKYVFNFDSFTWGPELVVHTADDQMKTLCRDSHEASGVSTSLSFTDKSGFWLDASPFEPLGCRALSISTRGADVAHNCWHQTSDIPENVNSMWVEDNYRHFLKFIRLLQDV